jgi:hypothetical protein
VLLCEKPEFPKWQPDFSSIGRERPLWTRLSCNGYELCNSMEWVDWCEDNSIQVKICEGCGTTHCADGGYVDITRLGDMILWTESSEYYPESPNRYNPIQAIKEMGSAAIPVVLWDSWAETYQRFPGSYYFRPTRHIELRAAWLGELRTYNRAALGTSTIDQRFFTDSDIEIILSSQLLACSSLEVGDAIQAVKHLLKWLNDDPHAEIKGRLIGSDEYKGQIETLYFDNHHVDDWQALGMRDNIFTFAFGGGIVLSPESIQ